MSILEHNVMREEICKVTRTYDEKVIVMSILEHNVVREREREREGEYFHHCLGQFHHL